MSKLQRVLHVDDDDDIRVIARMALEMVGDLELHQCDSGRQALEEAAAFAPDLFLLDYMMPEMNGEDTLCELRRIPGLEKVPAIFMTARVQADVAATLLEKGALSVIAKPFDPMNLCALLHDAWNSRPATATILKWRERA
jgi:CheY-like chemotaxis protein